MFSLYSHGILGVVFTIAVADASQKSASWGRSQGKCLLLLVRSREERLLDVRGTSTA